MQDLKWIDSKELMVAKSDSLSVRLSGSDYNGYSETVIVEAYAGQCDQIYTFWQGVTGCTNSKWAFWIG